MINGVPPVNPNFDPQAVMTVADLLASGHKGKRSNSVRPM